MTILNAVMTGRGRPFGPGKGRSSIVKTPVDGPVRIGPLGLEGDQQVYARHGGPEKAVLHFAAEHYGRLASEFPEAAGVLSGGALFGENFASSGMTEETVCVGDVYRVGEATLAVTAPRQPCWKLAWRAGLPKLAWRLQETGWIGWYYRTVEEGRVQAGQAMELLDRPHADWPLSRVISGFYLSPLDAEFLRQLTGLEALGVEWRDLAGARLETGKVESWKSRLEVPGA